MMGTVMEPALDGFGHLGDRVHALVGRELPPDDDAKARAHVAACDDCRRKYDRLAGAVGALGALGAARAPEGFASRVLRRVRADKRSAGLRPLVENKVHYEGSIIVILAAAAAAAVLAYGVANSGGLFVKNDRPKSEAGAVLR